MSDRFRQQAYTRPITEALQANASLGRLLERLRESQARMALVSRALPPAMRAHVTAGALDAECWTLLAANGAVAAKLRQCLPMIEQTMMDHGWPNLALKIKILTESK